MLFFIHQPIIFQKEYIVMMSKLSVSRRQSKKTLEHIAKFQYSLENTIAQLFQLDGKTNKIICQTKKGNRGKIHKFTSHQSEGVQAFDYLSILESAKSLYVDCNCIKINDNAYKKKTTLKAPFWPVYRSFNEIIEFYISSSDDQSNFQNRKKTSEKSQENTECTKAPHSFLKMSDFSLYVIHHCENNEEDEMKWHHFVQKYTFTLTSKILYSMILTYDAEQGLLNSFSQKEKLFEMFVSEYCQKSKGSLNNLSKMQGFLMKSKQRIQKSIQEQNDPSFSDDHKRWQKLPSEHYKNYSTIRSNVIANFKEIHNGKKQVPNIFLNNLICRYLHAKQYKYQQTLDSVLQYLKWQKSMSDKYVFSMFQEIHNTDLFTFLGYDYQGRLVVLNKAANLFLDNMDIEHYNNYYMYYLQIFLQTKMKGYCDQICIIADIQGLSSINFKLGVTRRNVADSLKYGPQRQTTFFAVNVSLWAYSIWGIIKQLLPKHTQHKVNLIGKDQKQIVETLSKHMDIKIIPKYLGGENEVRFNEQMEEQKLRIAKKSNKPKIE